MFTLRHKWPHGLENLLATLTFILIAALAASLLLAPDLWVTETPAALSTLQHAVDSNLPVERAAPFERTENGLLSPASALADGRPALILFFPTDMCAYRYCRLPGELEREVIERFGGTVNFVVIPTQSVPAGNATAQGQTAVSDSQAVYPGTPYAEWLPAPVETPFGTGLEAPLIVLVSGQNEPLLQTDEYPSWREIEQRLASGLVK